MTLFFQEFLVNPDLNQNIIWKNCDSTSPCYDLIKPSNFFEGLDIEWSVNDCKRENCRVCNRMSRSKLENCTSNPPSSKGYQNKGWELVSLPVYHEGTWVNHKRAHAEIWWRHVYFWRQPSQVHAGKIVSNQPPDNPWGHNQLLRWRQPCRFDIFGLR